VRGNPEIPHDWLESEDSTGAHEALLHEAAGRRPSPFSRLTLGDGLGDGDTECDEAVEDGDADLEFGGLTIEVARGERLTEELEAVYLDPDAAAVAVAFGRAPGTVYGWLRCSPEIGP
jgi:hypothetical protein